MSEIAKIKSYNKLGETQKAVLRALMRAPEKSWAPGCGWVWTTNYKTAKLLDTLTKYDKINEIPGSSGGYVTKNEHGTYFFVGKVKGTKSPKTDTPAGSTKSEKASRRRVVKEPVIEYDVVRTDKFGDSVVKTLSTYAEALATVVEIGSEAIDFRPKGEDQWLVKSSYVCAEDIISILRYSVTD